MFQVLVRVQNLDLGPKWSGSQIGTRVPNCLDLSFSKWGPEKMVLSRNGFEIADEGLPQTQMYCKVPNGSLGNMA